jgi:hypothetical protein
VKNSWLDVVGTRFGEFSVNIWSRGCVNYKVATINQALARIFLSHTAHGLRFVCASFFFMLFDEGKKLRVN